MQKNNKLTLHYHAIFDPALEGGYNVLFPSFPGCVTFGRTFEEAKLKAQEVLELWIKEQSRLKTPYYPRSAHIHLLSVLISCLATLIFLSGIKREE